MLPQPRPLLLSLTVALSLLATSVNHVNAEITLHLSSSFAFPEIASKSMVLHDTEFTLETRETPNEGTTTGNSTRRALEIRTTQAKVPHIPSASSRRTSPRLRYELPKEQQFRLGVPSLQQGLHAPAPDITDRRTLLNLAWASWDAYHPMPDEGKWYDLDGVNWTSRFGWKPWEDGLRGHLFLTPDKSQGIIVFKGTSISTLGSRNSHTSKRDRLNDNLLFSCCCANVPWRVETTHPCDCKIGGGKCCSSCLTDALREEETYYTNAEMVVNYFRHKYPDTSFWLTGHSLGGSIASLVGIHYGLPTVTFEAPGERLAARRMGLVFDPSSSLTLNSSSSLSTSLLPSNDQLTHITHVFNNVDPLALGECTGALSLCAQAGYAMESKCHNGRVIMYDLKGQNKKKAKLNDEDGEIGAEVWELNLSKHRMAEVIKMLEEEDRDVPDAVEQTDCQDCSAWEFGEYDDEEVNKTWWRKVLGGLFGNRRIRS